MNFSTSVSFKIVILFAMLLSIANDTMGQELSEIKVTCSMNHEEMRVLFRQIREQTGLQFAFQPSLVDPYKDITLSKEERSVKATLDLAFRDTGLAYKKMDKTIMVFGSEEASIETTPSTASGLHYVSGRVVDKTGSAIPGVNIIIRGTSEGTVSDADGKYSLQVNEGDLLLFSFIGFKRFETGAGERTIIDVTLEEETATLNAVTINAGYYEVKEREATGNIAKVTAKDIERQPVTSPLMALQGRMAGVDVAPNNGTPGSFANVVVRGRNSISNPGATPLYVIDGIPVDSKPIQSDNIVVGQAVGSINQSNSGFDPLSTAVNPANIESIEVLKDADATAIYGSRGANGVILITTKRGNQSEKTSLDVSFYSGAGKPTGFLDLLNTKQYVALRKEAFANDHTAITAQNAPDLIVWDTTRYTNWQKELLGKPATITDLQANISSGNKFTSFRFGAGYHKEGMISPGDFGFSRISGNFNLNHTSSNQKFRAVISMNYGVTLNKLPAAGAIVERAIHLPPNGPALYDSNGNLNWENGTFNNPLAALTQTDKTRSNALILNGNLTYELAKGFAIKMNLGYNTLESNSLIKVSPFSSMNPATITNSTTASASFGQTNRIGWIAEPQLLYEYQGKGHSLNVVTGVTWQQNGSAYQLVLAEGYSSDVLLESLKGATKTTYANDQSSDYRYMATFWRIGYTFKDKYLLNLTGRRDGSSRFGPANRWGNFGAVGAGWIFSEEEFMRPLSFLSFGKLRGSYGITGSDQVGDYQYLSTYRFTTYLYQGKISLSPTSLTNPNYAWEQTSKFELALELGFLKDRIHVQTAAFLNRCSNQLLNYQLPSITGFSGVTQNLNATVENTGIEVTFNTVNVERKNFRWQSTFNLTIPRNNLISYPGLAESPDANKYVVGKPLNILKLYDYIGVNPTTGNYRVKDVDGNGTYDDFDKTSIVTVGRQYYGGLSNSFNYKGIDLSLLFQFASQTSQYSLFAIPGYSPNNLLSEVASNYWQKEGDLTKYARATRVDASAASGSSSANQSNASINNSSFVRLKTLSVSYFVPQKVLTKTPLQTLRIYLQGQNLLTFTDALNFDPETGPFSLPPLRMITAGLEIKL